MVERHEMRQTEKGDSNENEDHVGLGRQLMLPKKAPDIKHHVE